MWFLIGVIIFILFCLFVYFYFKIKIRNLIDKAGFTGVKLGEVIKEARLEDQELPKSLSSMDSIYLERIKNDFPGININEIKRQAEEVLFKCFKAIESGDTSSLKGKMKEFSDAIINDNMGHVVKYDDIKIHKTVVSNYKNDKGVATIYFSSSFQYFLVKDGKSVKTQDRVRYEFIYIYDVEKVDISVKVLGIHCPNCGSPITSLGEKSCSYCGSAVREIFGRVFSCNDIVRY